jgi:hypothetical protein
MTGTTDKDGFTPPTNHPLYPLRLVFTTLPAPFQVGQLVDMMTFKGNICHPTALAFFSQQAFGQFSLAADNGKRRDFIGSSAFSVKSR